MPNQILATILFGGLLLAGFVSLIFWRDFFKFSGLTIFLYLIIALVPVLLTALYSSFFLVALYIAVRYGFGELPPGVDQSLVKYTWGLVGVLYVIGLGITIKKLAALQKKKDSEHQGSSDFDAWF